MIENFNLLYKDFFQEADCKKRWERLKEIYVEDYGSFRVLFSVETLALLDKWEEPSPDQLNCMLRHVTEGGVLAIRIGDVMDLMSSVWPLEVAKYDFQVFKAMLRGDTNKYPFTWIKCYATTLVQIWWAFETLINDFSGIIAESRKNSLSSQELDLLDETRRTIDKKGNVIAESYYQPVMNRVQFICKILTGKGIDRRSADWRNLMVLKNGNYIR